MGSFSIWHWAILLAPIVIPIIAVATENSGRTASRGKYAAVFGSIVIAGLVIGFIAKHAQSAPIMLIGMGLGVVMMIWFVRIVVQRTRDAGMPKPLAYLSAIPLVNWLFELYLLFPASRTMAR